MTEQGPATLLMSWRNAEDNQQIWRAAIQRGWSVERARGVEVPQLVDGRIVFYIESLFAPTLARKLGFRLLQTSESWLAELPFEYRQRDVQLTALGKIDESGFPKFIKPPVEKSFPAQIYESVDLLLKDYDHETPVLVASLVDWAVEFRCFCLDGRVRTLSPYLRRGELCSKQGFAATDHELNDASVFAERVLQDARVEVPRALVLDVGIIGNATWAVVESNGAWGSGIYGCDPIEALNVIEHATVK